jgi:3-dehydroquinate synthase
LTDSRIIVRTNSKEYPVIVGQNLLDRSGDLLDWSIGKAFIVTDEIVSEIYLDSLTQGLISSGIDTEQIVLKAGESLKTLDSVKVLYDFLASKRASRSDTLIALGGGVIGDIAGFVASTFKRGMNLVHVPTTLLAQVDSAVGGKTGFNLSEGKNLVGTFYQPVSVIVDVCTLKSLPTNDFVAGLAEVIKYGVIMDSEFFQLLIDNHKEILLRNPKVISTIVEQALRNKAKIVEADEREERGKREILNFGHTVGHAIEICSNHSVSHGQAVAIGMVEEARMAVSRGLLENSVLESLVNLLSLFGLATEIPDEVDINLIGEVVKQDKKVRNGQLTIPILVGLGKTEMMVVDPFDNLSLIRNEGDNIQC